MHAPPLLPLLRRLLLLLLPLGCKDAPTAPVTGELDVSIEGLTAGFVPAVVVTGPSSFRRVLDSTRTLASLPQGAYTIVAQAVTSGITRYGGSPASQTVTVSAGARAFAQPVSYGVASARLTMRVFGLPAGASGAITIRGPGAFTRVVTGDTQLDLLDPGSYTITSADVAAGGKLYRAVSATMPLELLPALASTPVTVEYGAGTATLRVDVTGLPAGTDAAIDVTGPNGFSRRLTSSYVLGRLEFGTYAVNARVVGSTLTTHNPTPATSPVTASTADTVRAAVAYNAVPLRLGGTLFAENLVQPVFLSAPDGDARQFIVERAGRIKIVANGLVLPTPFLDISSRVNNLGERGMLSMTFDPGFATNGFFYVFYVGLNGNVIVERLSATPGANVANPSGTPNIVISIPHGGSEHHGGMIEFGPDGMFYLAPGDGACCGDPRANAQNRFTMLGKILRINVRSLPYVVPTDNPFVAGGLGLPEIWAYGLRNAWRFSFDAPSGMLFIGDVGQDAHEEVNAVSVRAAGLNFGWPFTEGNACYNPATNCVSGRNLTLPVIDYAHSDGCSVIGGFVYRGTAIPELVGHYLYADFCRGWLRSFQLVNGRADELRSWPEVSLPFTNSFGKDGAGELYMIAGTKVWKLVRTGR